jgi:hypothetical protein
MKCALTAKSLRVCILKVWEFITAIGSAHNVLRRYYSIARGGAERGLNRYHRNSATGDGATVSFDDLPILACTWQTAPISQLVDCLIGWRNFPRRRSVITTFVHRKMKRAIFYLNRPEILPRPPSHVFFLSGRVGCPPFPGSLWRRQASLVDRPAAALSGRS